MMTSLLATLAMAAQPAGSEAQPASMLSSMLPLVVIFAIFYFLMIRPQQKQQKKHKAMLEALKRGDKVMTRGGIFGTVFEITDKVVTLEVDTNAKLRVARDAIAVVENNKPS